MSASKQDPIHVIDVTFKSTWEEGVVQTAAKLNLLTGHVFLIETLEWEADGLEHLVKEEILPRDGDAQALGVDSSLLVEADDSNDYYVCDGEAREVLRNYGEARVEKQNDTLVKRLRETCQETVAILRAYAQDAMHADQPGMRPADLKLLAQLIRMRTSEPLFTCVRTDGGPVVQAAAWPNGANVAAHDAMLFLADYGRPSPGGEDRFNALHLHQIADEIEGFALRPESMPLYASREAADIGHASPPAATDLKSIQDRLNETLKPGPDDGPFARVYDTGALDALGSMVLALHSRGDVPKTAIADALRTTLDAIGNHAPDDGDDGPAADAWRKESAADYSVRGWLAALADASHGGAGAALPHTQEKLKELLRAMAAGRLIYASPSDMVFRGEPDRQAPKDKKPAPRG